MAKGVYERKPFTAEHCAAISIARKGMRFTQEHCKRLSEAKIGSQNPLYGKERDLATKIKMSSSRKAFLEENPEALAKLRAQRILRGEKNGRWVADKTKLRVSEGTYAHWNWAKGVKRRDKWKCQIANHDCSGRMEAHHILNWKDYPDLRYEMRNGITLCHFHHPRGRKSEKEMETVLQDLLKASETFYG